MYYHFVPKVKKPARIQEREYIISKHKIYYKS